VGVADEWGQAVILHFVVTRAVPILTASLYSVADEQGQPVSLSTSSITQDGSASSVATLASGSSPTGTIAFFFSTTNTCPASGATQVGSPVAVTGDADYSSTSQVFTSPGTYYWYAVYSGDSNNAAVVSPCEPLTVTAR